MGKVHYSSKIEQKVSPTSTTAPDDYANILLRMAEKTMVPMYPDHQKKTVEKG